jgi:hypothetical protein
MPAAHRPAPVAPMPPMVRPLVRLVFDADTRLVGRIWYLNGRETFEARPR